MITSQKKIEEKVLKFLRNNNLISRGDKLIVALSGGADSVFALYFFLKYKKLFDLTLIAVHINHSLRGKESDDDEQFCSDLCKKTGISFYSGKVDVKNYAAKNKLSIEEAARNLRYEKLYEFAGELNADKIVVAHNSNDNSETILLNFFKGAGIAGLSGIPVKRDKIIRPLLSLSKDEILFYLKKKNINFRFDSSNENIDFERNFIRQKIVPLIKEKINPKIDEALLKNSTVIKNFYSSFQLYIKEIVEKYAEISDENIKLNLSVVKNYGNEIFGEILKVLFEDYLKLNFNYKNFEAISGLLGKQKGKKIQLSQKFFVIKEKDYLVFTKLSRSNVVKKIEIGETVEFDGSKISVFEVDKNNYLSTSDKKNEFISGDKISGKFLLRRWKNGDKFIPLGRKSFKKLSDFLTDEKITHLEKNKQLVLVNNKNIVWVIGRRIDERYKVIQSTKKIYKLCLN